MTTREANRTKALRRCLKCGREMWTDRCRRICVPCATTNEEFAEGRGWIAPEFRQWVRGLSDSGNGFGGVAELTAMPALLED